MVEHLNRTMTGWANYFCLGQVSPAYRAIDRHAVRLAASVALSEAQGEVRGVCALLGRETGETHGLSQRRRAFRGRA